MKFFKKAVFLLLISSLATPPSLCSERKSSALLTGIGGFFCFSAAISTVALVDCLKNNSHRLPNTTTREHQKDTFQLVLASLATTIAFSTVGTTFLSWSKESRGASLSTHKRGL